MKTISKSLAFLLLTVFLFFCFTGCVGKDGEIYGQREVLEYVDSVCAEPYHLVERELVEEDPDNMEYRFMADNRELSFTADVYKRQVRSSWNCDKNRNRRNASFTRKKAKGFLMK